MEYHHFKIDCMTEQTKKAPELKKLTIQGDTYVTRLSHKYERRQNWVKPDASVILSYIPGTIRQVLVKPGDVVKAGDKLLVLEAMKMMNTIYAHTQGTIRSVSVSVGDRIPKGAEMVRFG
jgi:biotin carboxyl carrier protein